MPQLNGMVDIAQNVQFGELCIVWNFTVICANAVIGNRCVIGSHCYIGNGAVIGDNTRLQDGAHIVGGARVGNNVFIGMHVVLMDDRYPQVLNPEYKREPPYIGDYVSIGCNATILPGVTLHMGCVVGAGSVVTKDVPAGHIVYGNPARFSRIRPGYEKVPADAS